MSTTITTTAQEPVTTIAQARALVGDTPGGTTPGRGERIHDFVRDHRFENCLELGFAHGVGSVYIASALEANGRGRLTSVDVPSALERSPLASELLEQAGLSDRVCFEIEQTSYTWFLHRALREQLRDATIEPIYDFVFLDGAHTWDVDGLAFLLVDKLLKPGGWILFDDLYWRLDPACWRDVPEAERALAQVKEVWELLVITHPGYDEMRATVLGLGAQGDHARPARRGWSPKPRRCSSQLREATRGMCESELHSDTGHRAQRLLLISPVRNEEAYLELVAAALAVPDASARTCGWSSTTAPPTARQRSWRAGRADRLPAASSTPPSCRSRASQGSAGDRGRAANLQPRPQQRRLASRSRTSPSSTVTPSCRPITSSGCSASSQRDPELGLGRRPVRRPRPRRQRRGLEGRADPRRAPRARDA